MNESKSKSQDKHAARQWRLAQPLWVQITVLLLVFLLGGFAGAMIGVRSVYARMEYLRSNPDALPSIAVPRLERLLALNEEQSAQVRDIIGRRHPRIIKHLDQGKEGMHTEFNAMAEEVAGILDEKQNAKWNAVADRIRSQFLPR